MRLETLESIVRSLDGRLIIDLRWHGAALDRLLDERHAGLVGTVANILDQLGWQVAPEVSYAHFGERGSIDLLAWHAQTRTVLVIEVKSQLGSIEETIRKLDEKVRLSMRVVGERFAWRPTVTGRLLVLPDFSTPRRHVLEHRSVLDRAFPARGRTVLAWLRSPAGSVSGILFVRLAPRDPGSRPIRERIRRPIEHRLRSTRGRAIEETTAVPALGAAAAARLTE